MSNLSSKHYADWHWGIQHQAVKKWDDPDYPEGDLIECGRLVELRVHQPGVRKTTIIKLKKDESNNSHLCFDPEHSNQRLYILAAPKLQSRMKETFIESSKRNPKQKVMPFMSLNEMAAKIGGRHKTPDYAYVDCMPVGVLTHVIYACEKGEDQYSFYIHKLGEESGLRPWLAVDRKGRPWIVGGNYTCPTPGITD
jgi:hypothetical protein